MATVRREDLIHILCKISLHLKGKKGEKEDIEGLGCFYWLSISFVSHPVPGPQENIFTIYPILSYPIEVYKKDTTGERGSC